MRYISVGALGTRTLLHPSVRGVLMELTPVADSKRNADVNWQVYIILCSDKSLYTGITTDVERRFAQHLAGSGAKYFRGRLPHQLVYLEGNHDHSSASRREVEIKRLRPDDKRPQIDRFSLLPHAYDHVKPKTRLGKPLKPTKSLKISEFCTDHPLHIPPDQCIVASGSL